MNQYGLHTTHHSPLCRQRKLPESPEADPGGGMGLATLPSLQEEAWDFITVIEALWIDE